MTIKSKTKASIGGLTTGSQVHLIDILNAVKPSPISVVAFAGNPARRVAGEVRDQV
jgi:hypothetical protein